MSSKWYIKLWSSAIIVCLLYLHYKSYIYSLEINDGLGYAVHSSLYSSCLCFMIITCCNIKVESIGMQYILRVKCFYVKCKVEHAGAWLCKITKTLMRKRLQVVLTVVCNQDPYVLSLNFRFRHWKAIFKNYVIIYVKVTSEKRKIKKKGVLTFTMTELQICPKTFLWYWSEEKQEYLETTCVFDLLIANHLTY